MSNNSHPNAAIFQVPAVVPESEPVRAGVKEILLHEHLMEVQGKKGLFKVSMKEIRDTEETQQADRRDIYHVMSGEGLIVLDGKEHSLTTGALLIIAPKSTFKFNSNSSKRLTALCISVPDIFPVRDDKSVVTRIDTGPAEMSVCGFKKFLHVLRNDLGEGAHVALLDITGAPRHVHKYTLEYYYFHNGGIMNLDGVDHPVKQGTMVILPPGVVHAARALKPGENTLAYMGYFPPLLYRNNQWRDEYLIGSGEGQVKETTTQQGIATSSSAMSFETPSAELPTSIAIAGAWGYIGRKLLDAALHRGVRTYVYDPGPPPDDVTPASYTRLTDPSEFYNLDVDLFHLALHPAGREQALSILLNRGITEPLFVLNEKPMVSPDHPEDGLRIIEITDRSQAVMLYNFPELFDPLTLRIVEFLKRFQKVEVNSMFVQRSKDREDPTISRNRKLMLPIQFQESVHCLAFVIYLLATISGDLKSVLSKGIAVAAKSAPYCPPNPEDYSSPVDGRCEYQLRLGDVAVRGLTDFKRDAIWRKRRIVRGMADGKPFTIEVDYLEGEKFLKIDGVDQRCDPNDCSYEAVLSTLTRWRSKVSPAMLREGVYPNPRLAWIVFQLSGVLWKSSKAGGPIELADFSALNQFESGFQAR